MAGGNDHPHDAGPDDRELDGPPDGDLRDLAVELGVSLDYWDWQGRYVPVVGQDRARRAARPRPGRHESGLGPGAP